MNAPSAQLLDYLRALPPTRGQRAAVLATSELRRIRDAQRYDWRSDPYAQAVTEHYTAVLRTAHGRQALRPVQAAVLRALHELGGCFAPVRTGGGKTLISLLAAETFGAERTVLLVPASLRDKTRREAHAAVSDWKIRPIRILSYESLGRLAEAEALERYAPDLLICDESHYLKNTKAAVTRRVKRYIDKRRKAGERLGLICMSGSITSRTLRDYWHQLRWCLGEAMPLPREPEEVQQWMWAIDEKVSDGMRWAPGALLEISPTEPDDPESDLDAARARYGRRLLSTRGVVGSGGDMPQVGLICRVTALRPTEVVRAAVERMRATWETPCGLPFETAMDLWRHERELSAGFYYRWKVQPPWEWLTARKTWSAFVRETLKHSRTFDSPMAVAKAVHDGRLQDNGALAAWRSVEPIFKPDTEAVWIDDQTLRVAAEWLHTEGGIAWVHHGAFGRALEQLSGVPYFAAEGCNAAGVAIDMHDGPAIASLSSCSRGFNLQGTPSTKARHYRNLIVTCPTKNAQLEQTISRTHRDGQEQDDVYATFLQTLEGDVKALEQALADASYVERTTLQPQRLGLATWL